MNKKITINDVLIYLSLTIASVIFILPIYIILISSFKDQSLIMLDPFKFPIDLKYANYTNGIRSVGFFSAFLLSLWITIASVFVIVIFTSMTAWMITRVKLKIMKYLYYAFVFSMIVPFQLVMYPMVWTASRWFHIANPIGIIVLYLGFGAGLSVFIFSGFVKTVPIEIEEAALIDGCNPMQTFTYVILPILKPTIITVAILNAMWIWNDFLLPYTVLDLSRYKTIPIAIQYLRTGHGSIDFGALTALIILTIIPIIVFYFSSQKYIIEGVTSGAIKS